LQLAALCVSLLLKQLQRLNTDRVLWVSWIITPRQQHHTCITQQDTVAHST
jgi:hypothetical protein